MALPPYAPYASRRPGRILTLDADSVGSLRNALRDGGYGGSVLVSPESAANAEVCLSWTVEAADPGLYELWALYAAGESRPMTLRIGGVDAMSDLLWETTGGWHETDAVWRHQGAVALPGGRVDLSLQRIGWIPSLVGLALFPVEGEADVPSCDARRVQEARIEALAGRLTGDERMALARGVVPTLRHLVTMERQEADIAAVMNAVLSAVRRDVETPSQRLGFGGPLNGQKLRRRILRDLDALLHFDAFIETGAYRGTTTEFLAHHGRPVFSCELDEAAYYDSVIRLCHLPNVSLFNGDSRAFLSGLLTDGSPRFRMPLFYLDAHWNDDLPLADEVELIAGRCGEFVIMVDDFKHPLHGYAYDAYENGLELTLEYLAPRLPAGSDLVPLMPWMPPQAESGAKRGTLFLVPRGLYDRVLRQVSLLEPIPLPATGPSA